MSCLHQPEDRGIHQAPEEEYQEEDRDSEPAPLEAEASEEEESLRAAELSFIVQVILHQADHIPADHIRAEAL